VIQVFLVTTFSSGAAAVATKIAQDPGQVPALLAQNLPKASNFYLTYFILQGTSAAADSVLNYSDLLEYLGYDYFFDKTPRAKYNRYTSTKGIAWGKIYPKFANFAIIAIAYSCIAPLVLGFAAAGLSLYYLAYRYNLLFVIQPKVDTRGEAYAKALQHILTGVYLSELCLLGLFSIKDAPGPAVLVALLLVLTIFYQIALNRFLKPLEKYLPNQLRPEDEEAPLLAGEDDEDRGLHDPHAGSRLQSALGSWLPSLLVNPLARFLEPHVYDEHNGLRSWFEDADADEPPEYTEDEYKNAYLNPALTSKTPKLWLVRDEMGVSRREIGLNEKVGISTTDEGATLDGKNGVVWPKDNLEECPIFKVPKKY
ncbi:hypothetical protein LTS18_003705, partial [Coniosporium uncinatum]